MHRIKQNTGAAKPEWIWPRRAKITSWATAAVIVVFAVLALIFRRRITVESIVGFTPENLWLAGLVFMLLYALKSLTSVVYVKLLYLAAGLVFPLPAAVAVSVAGSLVELVIPYFIGRVGGRGLADYMLKRYPKLERLSALRNCSNFWFSVFARATGIFPLDPVSIYFGACGMPFPAFMLGSTAGLLPVLLVTVILGTEATEPGSPAFVLSAVLFIVLQAGAAAAFLIWIHKNNAAIKAAEKEASPDESAQ